MESDNGSKRDSVGIAAIGSYIPAGFETSRQMAEQSGFPEYVFTDKIGVRRKPVAAADEHPGDMGIKAALDALGRAEISPKEVDVVAFCGCGFYDYGVWSPAARIQHEIGASRAFAYEIKNGCNGGNLGLYLVSRQLLADPDLHCALVVCSDVFSRLVDYGDERIISMFPGGDGATAAVLRKNHPRNRLLSFAAISDGSLVNAVYVPAGGTRSVRNAVSAGSAADGPGYWQIEDPEHLARVFSDLYLTNYVRVVREAVRKCGREVQEIAYLFTNQVKKSTLEAIFAALGLSTEQTCRTIEHYGHLSCSDTLLGLEQSLAAGRLRDGDLVVLASSGIGFNWAATTLQH